MPLIPRIPSDQTNVWPAFTDAMVAFVLVLILSLAFLIGGRIEIGESNPGGPIRRAEQDSVRHILSRFRGVEVKPTTTINQDITLGSDVTFEPARADLSPSGQTLVRTLAETIVSGRVTSGRRGICSLEEIQVHGHTDNVPINTFEFPSNWELSTARASRVVRTLIESGLDVGAIRMSATGYGESRPILPNSTVENRALNRRIELRLIYSDSLAMTNCLS